MKPAKTPTLPTSTDATQLAKAVTNVETGAATNPLTARLKGLVQTAKGKWNGLKNGEAEALAQGPGVVVSPEAERLAAEALAKESQMAEEAAAAEASRMAEEEAAREAERLAALELQAETGGEDVELEEGESMDDLKARMGKLKPKKPSIPSDLLNNANSYDDKVALIRMIVADNSGRVASVMRNMIQP